MRQKMMHVAFCYRLISLTERAAVSLITVY